MVRSEPPASSFASDNAAGVLPEVMEALVAANQGSALAYGADAWTARVEQRFCELFDRDVATALTWGGTGANVVGLHTVLRPWDAVICGKGAHINVDECGAVERIVGAQLIPVATEEGKLTVDVVEAQLQVLGDEHHAQPRVVSITQSTEVGTLYRADEIADLAAVAHENGLLLHVDGARIANATAALGGDVRAFTSEVGVDIVSFGGTKAGGMYGEAVVFLRPELGDDVRFARKQAGQLPSKMRFVAAQFEALLTDDLWLRAAAHANAMALSLAEAVRNIADVQLVRDPVVNSVFARIPRSCLVALQNWSMFWEWEPAVTEVRWMTHFATTSQDVERFAEGIRTIIEERTAHGSDEGSGNGR